MRFFRREQMDCCNYVESTGSRIVMDSDTNWMELESIQGNTTQLSTTGAQLLDVNLGTTQTINGITYTINTDGTIVANGTATAVSILIINLVNPIPIGTVLYLGANNDVVPEGSTEIHLRLSGSGVIPNSSFWLSNINAGTIFTVTNEIATSFNFRIGNGQTVNNFKIKPMLCYDSMKSWEPYTGGKPSPSPQYPQEIKGIGESGNINVTVAGAQLFDITKYFTSIDQWIITDNRISIENPTSTYLTIIYTINVLPNTTYTLSSIIHNYIAGTNSMHIVVSIIKNTGEVISNVVIIDEASSSPKTFTVPEDGKQINIYIRNRTTGNGGYVENVMLNQGNTSLPWQPYYSSQNISITLTTPLYGINNYNDEIAVIKRIDKCIELTFDGSETWRVYNGDYYGFYLSDCLPVGMNRRIGFCNQFIVDTIATNMDNRIWLGTGGNKVLYVVKNSFYDESVTDKGLAAWKAHLSTNPLKIVTYIIEGWKETPLDKSNIDNIKSLYAYKGNTVITNNENATMVAMYKKKS